MLGLYYQVMDQTVKLYTLEILIWMVMRARSEG